MANPLRIIVFGILPIAGLIGATIGGIVLMDALKPEPEAATEAPRGLAVFVVEARPGDAALTVRAQGEVRPRREIDISPQVGGRITAIADAFLDGGFFQTGDVLARVDDADYRLAVTRTEAQVAQARRALEREIAEADLARRDWEDLGAGDASPLTLREPQLAEARANLAAAEAALGDAQLQLSRTVIRAPFDGRVREKMVDIGQVVSPGQRLGRVFSTDAAEVRVPLSDADLALLALPIAFGHSDAAPGPEVRLSAVVAGERRTWIGRLVRTDSAIDPRTRTLSGIVEVLDPYGAAAEGAGSPLAIGLFVDAEVDGALYSDVFELPRDAVRGADQVFVAERAGALAIRTVDVLYSDRERAIVASGLAEGEFVVTSPVLSPRAGMKIEAYDQEGTLLFPPRPAAEPKPAEGAKS